MCASEGGRNAKFFGQMHNQRPKGKFPESRHLGGVVVTRFGDGRIYIPTDGRTEGVYRLALLAEWC